MTFSKKIVILAIILMIVAPFILLLIDPSGNGEYSHFNLLFWGGLVLLIVATKSYSNIVSVSGEIIKSSMNIAVPIIKIILFVSIIFVAAYLILYGLRAFVHFLIY